MADQQRTAEDDLEAGFREGAGDEPVETREAEPQEQEQATPETGEGQDTGSPEGQEPPEPPEDPVVPGLGMTASQVRQQLAMVEQMRGEFDQSMRKAYGKIGELNSTLQKLQSRGPGKVNEAALKRLKDEYGDDLAEIIPSLFSPSQEAAQDPTGSQERSGVDPDMLRQEFDQRLQQQLKNTTYEVGASLIASFHPDWKQQAASPEFQEWRSSQPADVQQAMTKSRDPAYVVQQLNAFKNWVKTRSANAANRNRRLENAITPEGVETAGSRQPSRDEDFLAGFHEEDGR